MTTLVKNQLSFYGIRVEDGNFCLEGLLNTNFVAYDMPKAKPYIQPVLSSIIEEVTSFVEGTTGLKVESIPEIFIEFDEEKDSVLFHPYITFKNTDEILTDKISVIQNKQLFIDLLEDMSKIPDLQVFKPTFKEKQHVYVLNPDTKKPIYEFPHKVEMVLKKNDKYFYLLHGFSWDDHHSEVAEELLTEYVQ